MNNKKQKRYLSYLIQTCMAGSLVLPAVAFSQQEAPELEEVVVTGSFIRNSAFAQNNPVDTVSQADIKAAGAPNMGNYIRDLSYTQNTNTVNSVNAGASGPQTSVGTTFNLRGLGENSTLTLLDGMRSVDSAINTLLPEIAIERMEVVLDGGSALYGSDAVAGVVNLIPIKSFDGLRVRMNYQRDQPGDFEDNRLGVLWGKTFSNGIEYVVAVEHAVTTPLMNPERPKLLKASYGWATSGNPGVYRRVNNAIPVPGALHGGTVTGGNLLDPSCGTFNQGATDFGQANNNPSGIVRPGNNCFFNYSQQWPLASGKQESNFFQNIDYELPSGVRLNAQMSIANRAQDNHNTLTYQLNGNNRDGLVVPANHPANPFSVDLVPFEWRPFANAGTLPSYTDPTTGARLNKNNTLIQRYKVGAMFDLSSSWTANTAFSYQRSHTSSLNHSINMTHLQSALIGRGGPTGKEWFNPFGSADTRSPFYRAGVTGNTQALVDWIAPSVRYRSGKTELTVFELNTTGDLIELPAGMSQMAVGYQMRDIADSDNAHPLSKIRQNYNASIRDSVPVDRRYGSRVQAAYLELELPLFETVDAQVAIRHERFTTYDLATTTPKVALRWEVLPTLALRGSVGESFLAPTPSSARPFDPNENCGEIFFGSDPLTGGLLNGGATCSSGNPDLRPETSDIWNVGFTWEPMDSFSLSMDYQSIEYIDRIRTLGTLDIVDIEYTEMLKAIGSTRATYSSALGSATRNAANAWIAAGGTPLARVTRESATQRVNRVVSQSKNVSSVWVDLFDARARYSIDTSNLGSFTTTLSATYNTDYKYDGGQGVIVDALGLQNDRTGIVGPIPKLKAQARLAWFRDNHSASLSYNHQDSVAYDAIVQNALTGTPPPSNGRVRAWTITNAQYSYLFDGYLDSDINLSIGVNNLFDREPQRLPMLGGFASRLHTPWGRRFYMSVEWEPQS